MSNTGRFTVRIKGFDGLWRVVTWCATAADAKAYASENIVAARRVAIFEGRRMVVRG